MSSVDDHDLLDIEDGDDYGEEIDYKREEELLQDEDLEEDEEEQSTQPDLILHNEEEIDEEEDNSDNTNRQDKFSTERANLPNKQIVNNNSKPHFRNKTRKFYPNKPKYLNNERRRPKNFVHVNPHFNGTVSVNNDGSRLVWGHQQQQQINPWLNNNVTTTNIPPLIPPPIQIATFQPQQQQPLLPAPPQQPWLQQPQTFQPCFQQPTVIQQPQRFPQTQPFNQTQGFSNQNFMQWNDHCEVPYSQFDQGQFFQNPVQSISVHERLGFPQTQLRIAQNVPPQKLHSTPLLPLQTPQSVINFNNYCYPKNNKRFISNDIPRKKLRSNNNTRPVILKQEIKITQAPKPAPENVKQDVELNSEDEETRLYRLKIEEQKRKREEILARKEARRKIAANEQTQQNQQQQPQQPLVRQKQHQNNNQNFCNKTYHKNNNRGNRIIIPQSNNITVKTVKYIGIMDQNENPQNPPKPTTSTFFNQRTVLAKDNSLAETNIVVVKNLSDNTDQRKIISLCKNIGDVEKLHREKSERQATIHFKSVASAHAFYKKYQRYMLDLSMIEVSLKPK